MLKSHFNAHYKVSILIILPTYSLKILKLLSLELCFLKPESICHCLLTSIQKVRLIVVILKQPNLIFIFLLVLPHHS